MWEKDQQPNRNTGEWYEQAMYRKIKRWKDVLQLHQCKEKYKLKHQWSGKVC